MTEQRRDKGGRQVVEEARRLAALIQAIRALRPDDLALQTIAAEFESLVGKWNSVEIQHDVRQAGIERDNTDLRKNRQVWRQLFDLAPDLYLVTDRTGLVVDANRRATAMFTLPRRSHRALVLRFARSCRAAVRNPEGHPDPIPVQLADNADFRGQLRCVPIGDERVLWLLRDVSDAERGRELLLEAVERERHAADQLRAVDSMRRAFLLAASHDLRSPMAAIAALASVLSDPQLSDEQRARAVDRIEVTANDTMSLLDNLLDYERIDASEPQLRFESVDLGPVVERAARSVAVADHRLELKVGPAKGQADIALVERIVANLVRNGIQHTPPGSTIWVSCGTQPDGLLLVVEDDGPGIPAEKRGQIFDLFQRGARARGGLGVGLALVRRFAELHGGYARVEDRVGGGSSFQVLLGRPPAPNGQVHSRPPQVNQHVPSPRKH